ncbi:MAG: beta-ketoacyl-[acyl-carrier-protein] synthase family protein [Bacteroidales bacterium]|nr:beta-ketoacyl-[acyl-carrier-protein] synthase family protein [Bacteroidales bacterium]
MNNIISVTGLGIICSIGNDADSVLDSLRKKESGVGSMNYLHSKHSYLPVGEVQLSNDQMKDILGIEDETPMSRTTLMGAIAIRQALNHAGISVEELNGKRVALISGTTVGGMDLTENYYEQMKTDDSLLYLPKSNECGKSTEEMAEIVGLVNAQTCTISTACSSALNSIILGSEMLKRNEVDVVIAGGSEALSRFHLNGFNTLMILDKEQCRPFDDTRAGLNLGEGAAFVVLEKNSDKSLAFVAGYGNRCDAFHQTASSDNGEGAYLAMKDALEMAHLKPEDIQYVNAHGTGTPNNDITESQALIRIFGEDMPEISSTKAFTGHTTSASGSIEAVICILAIQNNFTPANLGWKNKIEGGIVPTLGNDNIVLENVICNSFGFGGNDSSMVISKSAPVSVEENTPEYSYKIVAEEVVTDVEVLKELKEFVSPMESRRMGKLMKAAHLTSLRALKKAGIECPDAIITATSRGMLEISLQFLDDITSFGEELLKPTLFMQSTHNTLSSAIAIRTKCHGYNTTYSHGDESFEWAMRDAVRLIQTGKVNSVLVGSFDESTPSFSMIAERSGEEKPQDIFAKAIVLVKE